jgi:hypothetical protein
MNVSLLILAALCAAGKDAHLDANPLYRELRQQGVRVGADQRVPLPAPTAADGIDGPTLREKLTALPDRHVAVEELLRKSIVAPLVLGFRQIESKDKQRPVQAVDVWFVAYGDLEPLVQEDFLDDFVRKNQKDAKIRVLKAAELAARQIRLTAPEEQHERYAYSVFPVIDRVQVSAASHALMSRTADSLVFVAALDSRFDGDKEFPNSWRSIQKASGGRTEFGPAQPYDGAACYLKVTRLADPAGALLVEYHLVFVEPKAWFGGANLLRSKLPILIQSQVRSFRKQLAEAPAGK